MAVRKEYLWILLGAVLCEGSILSQQPAAASSNQSALPVGVWEAAQPDGSAVGIDLASVPASVPDAVLPEGTPRPQGSRLQIGVFQRQHRRIACLEENFFIVGWTGPGSSDSLVNYAGGKLEIDSYDPVNRSEIRLALVLDPINDVWTGHFHRERFDGDVVLRRTSDRPDSAQGGCILNVNVAPVPADCDQPELMANGRPSMVTVEPSLAFGFSMKENEFKPEDRIKLHVWVDNSGNVPAGVLTCSDLKLFKEQGFHLFDAHGHRLLSRFDAKLAEECKTNPLRANRRRGGLECTRNLETPIPPHTCVTRDDYDFTTDLDRYDLPPGIYTLRPRTNWKFAEDLCAPESSERLRKWPGDILFSVIQPQP